MHCSAMIWNAVHWQKLPENFKRMQQFRAHYTSSSNHRREKCAYCALVKDIWDEIIDLCNILVNFVFPFGWLKINFISSSIVVFLIARVYFRYPHIISDALLKKALFKYFSVSNILHTFLITPNISNNNTLF